MSMRLAVFSDVHGNLAALEAVLSDIAEQAVDEIVFAGDLCLVGPRPAACLERVRAEGFPAIYGNTDDWLLGRQRAPAHLAELAKWTNEQLDAEQRTWLDGLPFSYTVSPFENPAESLLVVHANPQDVNQIIFPSEEEQEAYYGRVRQPDGVLDDLLAGCTSNKIIFGHLHIPNVRRLGKTRLYNISSVSMAGNGDPRAKYGLFNWDGQGWRFERRTVSYDAALEITAYGTNKPPGWQEYAESIMAQGTVPQIV